MTWRISDPVHLLGAIRISLARGGAFLRGRIAPNGPILREPNLSYIYKASWGMHAAGVDHDTIALLLDWAQEEALQPNGDFYFPDEPPEYKDMQRMYRTATFGKVAAWIDHPVIRRAGVVERILQYQHKPSGGAFNYIGDDRDRVEPPATIGSLNTTFFGQLMIALDVRGPAVAAGDWVRNWVDANRDHIPQGLMYSQMTPDGDLVTDVQPGERICKVVDTRNPKQEFWHAGTSMAYLAVLYDTMLTRWGDSPERARPYLNAAIRLLDFESAMRLDTYLWPSKCKVGWGAGELIKVLIKHGLTDQEHGLDPDLLEKAYRVAERVAIFTFLDNQLPNGGWSGMHYPLSENLPEMAYSYKPLAGTVWVPQQRIPDPLTIYLPSEEISGEFLGEMKSIEEGLEAKLKAES